MSTVNSTQGKLIFRSLHLYPKVKTDKVVTIKNVLEWKWVNGHIVGKQVGDIEFDRNDANISQVRETKEIVYRPEEV